MHPEIRAVVAGRKTGDAKRGRVSFLTMFSASTRRLATWCVNMPLVDDTRQAAISAVPALGEKIVGDAAAEDSASPGEAVAPGRRAAADRRCSQRGLAARAYRRRAPAYAAIGARSRLRARGRRRRAFGDHGRMRGESSIVCSDATARVSSARASMPRAACGRRQHDVQGQPLANLGVESQPVEPGLGYTIAAYCPSLSLRMRVSTLPRRSAIVRSGRTCSSCGPRRRRLPVPTIAPGGRRQRREVDRKQRHRRHGPRGHGGEHQPRHRVGLGRSLGWRYGVGRSGRARAPLESLS